MIASVIAILESLPPWLVNLGALGGLLFLCFIAAAVIVLAFSLVIGFISVRCAEDINRAEAMRGTMVGKPYVWPDDTKRRER